MVFLKYLWRFLSEAASEASCYFQTEPFTTPVNKRDFPDYSNYIVQPMDLTHLEKHIKENIYGSPQAFEADAKWILHNSIIYNGCKHQNFTIS